MRLSRALLGLSLLAALMGCRKDDGTGSTVGTTVYVFDNTSHHVLVWKDMEALYDAATVPAPSVTLSATLMDGITNLAWGGLAMDPNRNLLYMVTTTGTVVRVSNLRLQTGAITNTQDIASFTLDSSKRLTNSQFGQVSVDPQSGILYISENGDNGTQIWVVGNASSILDGQTAAFQGLPPASISDTGGTGVVAGQNQVYAYMDGGSQVVDGSGNPYNGHRLRRSTNGSSFDGVIIDNTSGATTTLLGAYGSLALDTANNTLYVGVSTTKSGQPKSVLAFRTGDFNTGYNQAPDFKLDTPVLTDLRVLAHARTKDWLVGLRGVQPSNDPTADTAFGDLVVWKAPSSSSATTKTLSLGSYTLRGAALDGSGG